MAMTVSTVQSACRAVRCSMTARRRDSASGTGLQRLACKMAGAAVRSQIAGQQAQQSGFPAPFGPISAVISPPRSATETLSIICRLPR